MDGRRGRLVAGPWLMTSCPFLIRGSENMLSGYWDRRQNRIKWADGWLGGVVSYLRWLDSSISKSGHLGGAPSAGTRLPLPVKMEFLMQPIRRSTVLEEVNDSDILMEPLHYPVATPVVEQQLVSMQAVSVNGQICAAQTVADAEREGSPQASG